MQVHLRKMLMGAPGYCVSPANLFENAFGICFSALGYLPGMFWEYHSVSEFVSMGYLSKRRAAVVDELQLALMACFRSYLETVYELLAVGLFPFCCFISE